MERLRRRADFVAAARGAKSHGQSVILQAYARGDDGPARIGFTVSKKIGNAVERNRARRRLREAVRMAAAQTMRPGMDYVVIARREAIEFPFERLVKDVSGAVERVHRTRTAGGPGAARTGARAARIVSRT